MTSHNATKIITIHAIQRCNLVAQPSSAEAIRNFGNLTGRVVRSRRHVEGRLSMVDRPQQRSGSDGWRCYDVFKRHAIDVPSVALFSYYGICLELRCVFR